jgi:riboflavin synthase
MFTGIIETLGEITNIRKEQTNVHYTIASSLAPELKIDQSVAHNGVCLTVVEKSDKDYVVTAIDETLQRTNLSDWEIGKKVNIERCTQLNGRLDGHIVQGHVDTTGICKDISNEDGSWKFTIGFDASKEEYLTVEKGSICINGVSLTVVDSGLDFFSVAIIPYTYEHTNFHQLQIGDKVNLEFDIIGKYLVALEKRRR